MSGRFVNRLTLLLLLVCLTLGGVVAWELRSAQAMVAEPGQSIFDDRQTSPPADATLPASLPKTALQIYQTILDRPLFIKGRRPPEPPPPAVVAKNTKPLHFVLEGVALSGNKRVALLRNARSRELISIEEGGAQDDWSITSVLADRVVMSRNGLEQELLLEPPVTEPPLPKALKKQRSKK